jgi:hypothetical protein
LPYTKRGQLESRFRKYKDGGELSKRIRKSRLLKSEQVGKEKLYLNFRLLEVLKSIGISASRYAWLQNAHIDRQLSVTCMHGPS